MLSVLTWSLEQYSGRSCYLGLQISFSCNKVSTSLFVSTGCLEQYRSRTCYKGLQIGVSYNKVSELVTGF